MESGTATRPETPEALLARFRSTHDPRALAALFDRTAPQLFRVALAVAPDAATAEEAVQETFLAVLEDPGRCDPSDPVVPWLLGVLRHKVLDARRRERRVPDPLRLEPRILPQDPADEAGRREAIEKVRRALDGLEEPYRSVALLRWEYGLEPGEIAHVRREPPGTVRSTLHRALRKVRALLGAGGAFALLVGRDESAGLEGIRSLLLRKAAASKGIVVGGTLMTHATFAALLAATFAAGGATALAAIGTRETPAAPPARPEPAPAPPRERPAPAREPAGSPDSLPAPVLAPVAGSPASPDLLRGILDSLDGKWQHSFGLGTYLTLLPPEPVHAALAERWPALGTDYDRQQVLKAFAFARNPRALDVLDLGFRDRSGRVRSWAVDYLRWYSGKDFSEDAPGYEAWRAATRGRPLAEVLAPVREEWLRRLASATPAEMASFSDDLRTHAWICSGLPLRPEPLLEALEPWLTRAEEGTAIEVLRAACEAGAPEAWLRRALLPVLDRRPGMVPDALAILGEFRQRWAYDLCVAHLGDAPPVAASAAAALANLGDARAFPEILRALEGTGSADLQWDLESALSTLAGQNAGPVRGAAWWNDWWNRHRSRYEAR